MNYMNFNVLTLIMELIGTIAFASSGAMLAIQKEMDLFGVCVLGVTTSVGGGMIRDLLLGIIPPGMFRKPIYTSVAILTSILLFFIIYTRRNIKNKKIAEAYNKIMMVFDTVGLGIFTVVGIHTGRKEGYEQIFLLIFLGVITGVGGGLLRDMMAQEMPYILTKHIYACASISGAAVCVMSDSLLGDFWSMTVGMTVVMLVRFLATRYRWNLPKIRNSSGHDQ
ncbi:MAG: trimeric intracellular cation channel family protein [Eubacterium sp.]|nr:trimeric intracellular cation channel family protein [Eubacterium sp.]MCI8920229.1 trimeric intracellular cation channel family protein [Eubacterium sp.]